MPTMDEEFAKNLEKVIDDKVVKPPLNGGPTRPSKITLAVELDNVIASVEARLRGLEQVKAALETLKATL